MNNRNHDSNYGSSYNKRLDGHKSSDIIYGYEESDKKRDVKNRGENVSFKRQNSYIRPKKLIISSEELVNKLYREHGIRPVLLREPEVPLGTFIDAVSDEINPSGNRDEKSRGKSRYNHKSKKLLVESCDKKQRGNAVAAANNYRIETDRAKVSTHYSTDFPTPRTRCCRLGNEERRRRENSEFEKDSRDSLRNKVLSGQHSRRSWIGNEEKRSTNLECEIDSSDSKEDGFGAELRKKTIQTKNFVTSQVSKVKGLFSFIDLQSSSHKESEKEHSTMENRRISFNSARESNKHNLGATRLNMQRRTEATSSGGILKKILLSPVNRSMERQGPMNKNQRNTHRRTRNCEELQVDYKIPTKDDPNDSINLRRRSRRYEECFKVNQLLPAKVDSKGLELNISCTIDKHGTRSIKVINSSNDGKAKDDGNATKNCPKTAENHISADSLTVDLCYGSNRINVLPGSSLKGDAFSSAVLRKYQRSGSFLMASDGSTGHMFRLDIPERLFANNEVPFKSKFSLVNFLSEVLDEPNTDFVPVNNTNVEAEDAGGTKTIESNDTFDNLSYILPSLEENTKKTSVLKVRDKNKSSHETSTETNNYMNNCIDHQSDHLECDSQMVSSTDSMARSDKAESGTNGMEGNYCINGGDFSSVSDLSFYGSQNSNIIETNETNKSEGVCNALSHESHCLHYEFHSSDTLENAPLASKSGSNNERENDGVRVDSVSAGSQTPLKKTRSTFSKLGYKIYYQPAGTRSPWSKTRLAPGPYSLKAKGIPTKFKKHKMDEEILLRQAKTCQRNKKLPHVSNTKHYQVAYVHGDHMPAKTKRSPLSISSPLTFDNRNNLFSFKEGDKCCTMSPKVSREGFNCPLFHKRSSENLVKFTDSVLSWSSHCYRSVSSVTLVAAENERRESESSSSWTTANKADKVDTRKNRKENREKSSSEIPKKKIGVQSSSKNSKDSHVTQPTAATLHQDFLKNNLIRQIQSVSKEEKEIFATDFSHCLTSNAEVLSLLKSSSHNLNLCTDETKSQVDLIAKSCMVLNYLSQFLPAFRLISSSPLLGDVLLLTYVTLFGSKIEKRPSLGNVPSNTSRSRCQPNQRRSSI